MIVAPTEPDTLKVLGSVSLAPETFGVDFLFTGHGGLLCGVQRKEFSDLLGSVEDGRLTREVEQMQRLGIKALMVEGLPRWGSDGQLLDQYNFRWNRTAYQNLLTSIQAADIWLLQSDSLHHSYKVLTDFEAWCQKSDHTSLIKRPAQPTNSWGEKNHRGTQRWLLMGFDGLGPKQADKILDMIGMPIAWKVSIDELMSVPGVGPITARKWYKALDALEGISNDQSLPRRKRAPKKKAESSPNGATASRKKTSR